MLAHRFSGGGANRHFMTLGFAPPSLKGWATAFAYLIPIHPLSVSASPPPRANSLNSPASMNAP